MADYWVHYYAPFGVHHRNTRDVDEILCDEGTVNKPAYFRNCKPSTGLFAPASRFILDGEFILQTSMSEDTAQEH